MCSLCGNTPATCEHCFGAMLHPPYSVPKQEPQEQPKKFIGSGEDAHLFLIPLLFEQRCD